MGIMYRSSRSPAGSARASRRPAPPRPRPIGRNPGALEAFPALRGLRTRVGALVVIYYAMGNRSQDILATLKDWMAQHNAVIMSV